MAINEYVNTLKILDEIEDYRLSTENPDVRVIQAIISKIAGYENRAEWCNLLTQDKTSKYYAHCKAELPEIFN